LLRDGFPQLRRMQLAPSFRAEPDQFIPKPEHPRAGTYSADASISKMTQITERLKFQFRAERSCVEITDYMADEYHHRFNSVNFGAIVPHTTGTTGGVNPRSIQIGFRHLVGLSC